MQNILTVKTSKMKLVFVECTYLIYTKRFNHLFLLSSLLFQMRPEVNEKVRNRCLADCEDALSQLMICNYRTSAAHKRIQARARLTPKRKWTNEDIGNFELGLSLKGKNFFKIQKEHLPRKTIKDLVEYYYYVRKSVNFYHLNIF